MKKLKKLILVIPNSRWFNKRPWLILPHAPLILTALLKNDFNFEILDANINNLSEEECKLYLEKYNDIDGVLVSGFATEYYQQYHLIMKMVKSINKDIITILGGIYPTVSSQDAMKDENIDYIFIGHAEGRLNQFLNLILYFDLEKLETFPGIGYRDKNGNIVINPIYTYIHSNNNNKDNFKLVKPDYSLIDVKKYVDQLRFSKDYQFNSPNKIAPIISSYGCIYNCIFCATRTISGRGIAYRPLEDVLEEIEFLIDRYDVKNFVFLDECFLADRSRIKSILNIFIDRSYPITWKVASLSAWHLDDELLELMKRAGCTQITVSVESGSPRVLHKIIRKPLKLEIIPNIIKKCKELNIDIGANFVIGFPGETWDEIRQTFHFAEECNFDIVHFHIATPLPKTDLYEIAKRSELLPKEFNFTDDRYFGFGQAFITTDEFTPYELMVLRAFEWDRINFNSPEKISKIAKMMNLTIEELNNHRKQTRLKYGIHV